MVKIRLMRVGKRKQPSYRVVVADSRSPRDGRIIEAIGSYRPRLEPSVVEIDNERALYWLQEGAQPSDPVKKLLRISGAWSAFTGEEPAAPVGVAPSATPAASIKATPAASVTVPAPGAASEVGVAEERGATEAPTEAAAPATEAASES